MLAGCGGDDDGGGGGGGGGGGEELSQEEFVSEANKICREGAEKVNAKTQEIQQKIQDAGADAEDAAEGGRRRARGHREGVRPLPATSSGDLNPPESIQADWDKFLDGINNAFDLIPELADATRDGDRDKLPDLTTKFSQIAGDTRPFAQKYKLDDCLPENSPTS